MTVSRSSLFGDLEVDLSLDAPIGAMTWYGIGGRADMLVSPHTEAAAIELMRRCHQEEIPVRVLGGGANLLVDDDGVGGVVMRLDHSTFRHVRYSAQCEITSAICGAGADLFRLVQDTKRRGLAGFEMMSGIPGTVGGAVKMNAGGAWGAISDCLQTVHHLSLDGTMRIFDADGLGFRYRGSDLPPGMVLQVTVALHEDDPISVSDRVKEIFLHKRSTQPMADHSAGCAFRNPICPDDQPSISAGALIDQAGLKGRKIGGAVVSDQHANFILTEPGASANDVRRLIEEVRCVVQDVHGVTLESEVVIWGRDDTA